MRRRPIAALLAPLALAAPAGLAACASPPPTELSVSTYRVSGGSERALTRSLALHGPRLPNGERALAAVTLAFDPRFRVDDRPGSCRLRDVSVAVKADVTLPEWRERERARGELAEAWDGFLAYAIAHELEHVRIAQGYARRIEGAMRRASAPDCDALSDRLAPEIARILAEHDAAQNRFDAREQARLAARARAAAGR